ncbi:hypothetical protein WMY93_031242 [Mugilogobius chulae]|uniref:Uncharacterized protein n=1 Tax=Mugilogobius chulae TaxID=88201 RepID=A0AAW0MG01_9GOBI
MCSRWIVQSVVSLGRPVCSRWIVQSVVSLGRPMCSRWIVQSVVSLGRPVCSRWIVQSVVSLGRPCAAGGLFSRWSVWEVHVQPVDCSVGGQSGRSRVQRVDCSVGGQCGRSHVQPVDCSVGGQCGSPVCSRWIVQSVVSVGRPVCSRWIVQSVVSVGRPVCSRWIVQSVVSVGRPVCSRWIVQSVVSVGGPVCRQWSVMSGIVHPAKPNFTGRSPGCTRAVGEREGSWFFIIHTTASLVLVCESEWVSLSGVSFLSPLCGLGSFLQTQCFLECGSDFGQALCSSHVYLCDFLCQEAGSRPQQEEEVEQVRERGQFGLSLINTELHSAERGCAADSTLL